MNRSRVRFGAIVVAWIAWILVWLCALDVLNLPWWGKILAFTVLVSGFPIIGVLMPMRPAPPPDPDISPEPPQVPWTPPFLGDLDEKHRRTKHPE